MQETKIARLFKNGASQAVRLPAEFRFEGDIVYATRDALTGDVLLSLRPGASAWAAFFALAAESSVPADFMSERPLNEPPLERDVFADG